MQLGDAALVRVALHAPMEGPVQLGGVLAGTLDFRASHDAAAATPAAPKCIQVGVFLPFLEWLAIPSSKYMCSHDAAASSPFAPKCIQVGVFLPLYGWACFLFYGWGFSLLCGWEVFNAARIAV